MQLLCMESYETFNFNRPLHIEITYCTGSVSRMCTGYGITGHTGQTEVDSISSAHSVSFLQTSWPLLIKCCMIKEHNNLVLFKEETIFFILDKPMGGRQGEIHPFSAAVEGCIS